MWGRWGEGRTKRLRTGLVEFRVNEGGQERRKEQVFWARGKMDFWGQSRYRCGFVKPRFSRSLEGELDCKSWREARGWRVNTRKKPPNVGLRQWWADERVGSETTYSGAKGWDGTQPRTRCWLQWCHSNVLMQRYGGEEAEIREEPGKLTDGKDITHKHIPRMWVAHVRGTK